MRPRRSPGRKQALVRIAAAGVNFIDVYFRTGLYKADLPVTPGNEGAGTVEAVGPDVTEVKPGDRVAYAMARGSYAEYAVVPSARCWSRFRTMWISNTAAAAMLQGMTAHYLTHSTYPLEERRYVPGARRRRRRGRLDRADGQNAGRARVRHGLHRREGAHRARAWRGRSHSLHPAGFRSRSEARLPNGRGVDVVYDSVGKTTFDKSLSSLRPRGMMALFGQSSGPVPPFDPSILNAKGSLFLTRPSLAHHLLTREGARMARGRRAQLDRGRQAETAHRPHLSAGGSGRRAPRSGRPPHRRKAAADGLVKAA